MPGDALWALAACLLIEAFLAPVARIVCMCRYRVKLPPKDGLGSTDEQGAGAEWRGVSPEWRAYVERARAAESRVPDDSSEI
jgi:hypothetical protein